MRHAEREEWSVDEFLNWEEQQPERWELIGGQPWRMMAGGTISNARIARSIFEALSGKLRGGRCEAFIENVKVKTRRRVYYPDVFVRCGPVDPSATVVEDPVIVVEVISPSTENVDWGEKRREYLATPTVRHYLIVEPAKRLVTNWRWDGERWAEELAEKAGDVVGLDAVGAKLGFEEVFEGLGEDGDEVAPG